MWQLHLSKWQPRFAQPPGDSNRQAHGSKRGWQKLLTSLYCNQISYFADSQLFQVVKKQTVPPPSAQEMLPRRPAIREKLNFTNFHVWSKRTGKQTCMIHPPRIANNRDIKNKETQMLNPSARRFSQPSVLIDISTQSVTGPVLNHPINDTVMAYAIIHVKFLTWSCHCITVLPLDSLEKPKSSSKTHWFAWRPSTKNIQRLSIKASPTSDVAASSFEVAASICSTAWRHQPSSTWVKKRVAKTPHISLLQSNLLLCWQSVVQSHTKSTASSFCWGDGSSQTCHQEAQIHLITQLPVFGQNKREKKTCMMDILTAIRSHWDFNTISDRTSIESSNKRYSHGLCHNPCQISDLILSLYYSASLGFSWKAQVIVQNALICMTTKY